MKTVQLPNSLWKCSQCKSLMPVYLEKSSDRVFCRCSRCKRCLGSITEMHIQCLYSKRLKPEQGELAELSVRTGLCSAYSENIFQKTHDPDRQENEL